MTSVAVNGEGGKMGGVMNVRTSTLVDGRAIQGKGKTKGLYRIQSKQMFYVWYT